MKTQDGWDWPNGCTDERWPAEGGAFPLAPTHRPMCFHGALLFDSGSLEIEGEIAELRGYLLLKLAEAGVSCG